MEIPRQVIESLQRSRPEENEYSSDYFSKSQADIDEELDQMRRKHEDYLSRKSPNYDAKVADYLQSLHESEEKTIEYGDARVAFYNIWSDLIGRKPYIDPRDAWIVREFVKWLIRDETCAIDLDKGIIMMGTYGCGKTTLMRCGQRFANYFTKNTFGFKRIGTIILEVEAAKSISAINPYLTDNWCFDDIGQMNENVVVYSKHNIVQTLINRRVENDYFTLATTNLKPEQIVELYGPVVASRFNQMFNVMAFSTEVDCRKL